MQSRTGPARRKSDLAVEPVGVEVDSLPKPLDFAAMFDRPGPVELEIGSGKGTFLVQQLEARAGVNFLGIEWASPYWRQAADRLRRRGFAGRVVMLRTDAAAFVTDYVPDASLAAVHVYFPDPWPKARHHKRRLVQPDFLLQVERMLAPGGRLQVATDHADYWEQIRAVVADSPLQVVDYERPAGAREGEVAGTNFERKYVAEGRTFHAIAAVRAT